VNVTPARGARNVVCGLAGLLLGISLVGRLDSTPSPLTGAQKLRDFFEAKDEYTVIFAGDSHVFRQLDPAVFDAATAARGRATRAYNLGVPAHKFFEIDYQLRQVLRRDPARLRFLILDVSFGWDFVQLNLETERFVSWHDFRETLAAMWYTSKRREPEGALYDAFNEKTRLNNLHLEAFFSQETHHGRGFGIVRPWTAREAHPSTEVILPGYRRGYLSLEDTPDAAFRHRDFLERVERGETRWSAPVRPTLRPMPPYKKKLLEDLLLTLESRGLRVMFICGPLLSRPVEFPTDDPVLASPNRLFLYNDSSRFPNLFELDHRFDRYHLDQRGSEEYTRAVAADFLSFVDAAGN